MSRILVIFASTHGQTCKIAHRISEILIENGHSVDVFDAKEIPKPILPEKYEAVIVGASIHASGWQPKKKVVFAGGLAYSKYNILLKWWMKRISKKTAGDTDTSHDYEYTDWNAVSRFANEFSKKTHGDLGPSRCDQLKLNPIRRTVYQSFCFKRECCAPMQVMSLSGECPW